MRGGAVANQRRDVFRFRIELPDIRPPIWREILVPASYSFWDLHVAIQDAMGWEDYHLHEFEVAEPERSAATAGTCLGLVRGQCTDIVWHGLPRCGT
jgi:hypothetical protein